MKLLPIKSFQETLFQGFCGPAVLKMVLEYYGIHETERRLAALAGTTRNLGTDLTGLKKALKKFGLRMVVRDNAGFDDLQKYLDRKIPVIVDWFTRGRKDYSDSEIADGHYSIVVGLDKKFIYLQDPEIGKLRKIDKYDFLRVWFDYTGEYPRSKREFYIRRLIAVEK